MSRTIPPIDRRAAARFAALLVLPAILAVAVAPVRAQAVRNNLWVTDGQVISEAVSGNTLYLGGDFTRVGPAVGGWAPLDSVGNWVPPAPLVSGYVYCSAPDGNGGWYLGGDFNGASGQPRSNLAHFDANGNLSPWNPTVNSRVYAMLLFAGRLYVGGSFTSVDGQTRNHLAVIDTASGGVGTWSPILDGDVLAMTSFGSTFLIGGQFTHVSGFVRHYFAGIDTAGALWSLDPEPTGTVNAIGVVHRIVPNTVTVYLGGEFGTVAGQPRSYLAAVDATTGSGTFGQATAFNPGPDGIVKSLLLTGGTLTPTIYVGGYFQHLGGQPRSNLGAVNGSGSATAWNPGTDGEVYALGLRGTTLFVGGGFTALGGLPRLNAGAVDTGTGAVMAWDPSPNNLVLTFSIGAQSTAVGGGMTSVNGVLRPYLAALDLGSGAATGWNPVVDGEVDAMHVADGHLYAGGEFTHVGGVPRSRLAQIDLATAEPGAWAPAANDLVDCIASRPIAAGKSMIYFGGAFTTISGLARNGLAAMSDDPAAPGLDPWNPGIARDYSALAVSGSTIFVGGYFSQIGTGFSERLNLAALDTTGAATAWNPGTDGAVTSLATAGSLVYVGGVFASVGGEPHANLAAIDATSGSVQAWPASANNWVLALAATPGAIYVGGMFDSVGTSPRRFLAAIDPSTGSALSWNPQPSGPVALQLGYPVKALVEQGGTLYVGGSFYGMLGSPHSNLIGIAFATTAVDPGPLAGSLFGRAAIQALPNPSRGGVAFSLSAPRAGAMDVDVYAVDGRLVRTLKPAFASAGEQRVNWDGRDAAGRTVPAGVYLVHARSGAWEANGRVVRMR